MIETPKLPEAFYDFRKFLYLVWKFLNLPEPTPVQLDIAYYLMYGPRRKIIEAFRGVGKSWITSAYVVWRLRIDPQLNFLVVSASKDRSDAFSSFTMRLIYEMPVLQCLRPRPDQRESMVAFDVAPAQADHSPSVKSVGIFGMMTGSRADEIIADDVEVLNNSETQLKREKLAETIKEFDAILKPGGTITFLGTPQTEDTIYNMLPQRGYEKRIWPAKYPNEDQILSYGNSLAPFVLDRIAKGHKPGEPTDPKRFNEIDLMEREASYGRSGFARQFMLDTSLSDANRFPLKLRDLVIMDLDLERAPEKIIWSSDPRLIIADLPNVGLNSDRFYRPMETIGDWIPYQGSTMFVDPSGRGADELSYAVVKMLNGQLFVTSCGGMQGGYDEINLKRLCQIAKNHSVNLLLIESNFGDGMFNKLLEPYLTKIYPVTMEEVRHNKQKELRIIDTLEPVMNQHKLVIDRNVIRQDYESTQHLPPEQALNYQLCYQMTRITKERGALIHDDRLDALAGAVAYWVEQMGADADQQINNRRQELLDQELAIFEGTTSQSLDSLVLGLPPSISEANWIHR